MSERQGIGYHVRKALAAKAALAAEALETVDAQDLVEEVKEPVMPEAKNVAEPSTTELMAMMVSLLREIKESNSADAKDKAISQAEILEKILNKTIPENVAPPLISHYNPEGERDAPREPLKCQMLWVGYDLKTDTLTKDEIALLNRLQPGAFRVTKADGTVMPFTVTAKHNDRLELERLEVSFPCTGEHRHNHAPMTSYLRQALGERQPSVSELLAELAALKAAKAAA